jgi:hypothetical protein
MRFIAERGAPVAAKVIATGTGIERSKCYVIIKALSERGLIADRGAGFVIADPELWEAVRDSRTGTPRVAQSGDSTPSLGIVSRV